ncbi:PAS domain-containing protein [Hymenobacter caeli]|uniref:histidine kinase n=1 Tax=Hymenobacter caeli TaxID=2735894 RepID=A0ABX2FMQ5_9BACT|nr:PAS domain-containing sensor histidine kinase [Hymenobacter caeli]NRT18421.1 PAS domain S-box-containing protein [Hymenobacter caeli]
MPAPTAPAPVFDFRLVFAALPAPHALLGSDGRVEALNDAFLALLPGPVGAGLHQQPLAALLAACEAAGAWLAPAPVWAEVLATALATGQGQTLLPALHPAAPAGARYWRGTLQPLPEHYPAPRGLLLRLLDVTDQLHLEADPLRGYLRLRGLTEHLPQQVWTADAGGQMEFFNERTAEFLGPATRERARHDWRRAIHPDDQAPVLARWQRAVAQGTFFEAELRLLRHDGAYRWVLAQAQPARDARGRVLRWYGTNTDIHELHTLTHQLVRREREFRFLAESLPHLVWAADADGRLTFVNQRWVEYTGLTLAESQRTEWALLLPPEERAAAARDRAAYLAAGQEFEQRTRFREAGTGAYRWFLHRAQALYDEQGQFLRWYGTSTDVDDSARTQVLLEDQNQRLVRANQDFDNFVYAASHDLKQPINNMAGIFEELTRTAYFRDPDAVKLIEYFERALGQIYGTIDDLTAVVQLQRPEPPAPEPLALEPLVRDTIHSVQNQVTRLQAAITLDFAQCPEVRYVRAHLQSVLFNLLSNALKYAAPGRPPRIGLRAAPDPATGRPVLTVQDNGLGIDLDRFGAQLFQQFARFHAHIDGTGTGLYLVNRIVQSHGGRLEVASVVDAGTTFTIYL